MTRPLQAIDFEADSHVVAQALIGATLSIRMGYGDVWSSFGMCFLPILIVYYPLMMYGVDLAKSGDLTPHCVWLGNLVLAVVGAWQARRVMRY